MGNYKGVMIMEQLIKKYQNRTLEDWGSEMSPEAKQFAKDFKRRLNLNANKRGLTLVSWSVNHYDFSGFLKKDDKYVYFSYDIPRYETPVDLYGLSPHNAFLVRTAKHEKDYRGGYNNFCNILQFFDMVENLLER